MDLSREIPCKDGPRTDTAIAEFADEILNSIETFVGCMPFAVFIFRRTVDVNLQSLGLL